MLITGGLRTGAKTVWAYLDSGSSLWSYDTGDSVYGIAVDYLGFIYICGKAADNGDGNGTRNIWKLDPDGNYVAGAYVDSNANAWAIAVDRNYVYVGHGAGADRLSRALGSQSEILSSGVLCQAINADSAGNIYVGTTTLYKYNSALVQQWTEAVAAAIYSIDFLADASIIIGTADPEVRKYLADGTSPDAGTWAYVHPTGGWVRAAVDSSDNIYVVRYNSSAQADKRFVTLNSSGVLQWEIDRTDDLEAIAISIADAVYVVGDDTGDYSGWSVNLTGQSLTDLIEDDSTVLSAIAWSSANPVDQISLTRLVAIGNDEVWIENNPGVMSELTAANGDIQTSQLLTAAEAFQKLFIANGTNFKVVDFANTKLTSADAGLNPCSKGITLTGGTSAATLIVDFADAVTDDAALNVYGYRTSTATFVSGETVTGTNGDGDAVSFVLSAVEAPPPHWYTWTPFGNDTTTYGVMPNGASLVARYRGRLVLAGDPDYPHQWYMSKTANPWDWLYGSNSPLSAVAGNDADAGEIGDIIRALIPYGDDYLVIGCSHSMHILTGDPAYGGSLDELSETTGIWGPFAWCKDSNNNLYFFSNEALYMMEGGRSRPVNLSVGALPNMAATFNPDQGLDRVVLSFDPVRQGIVISKTVLNTGACSGFWYSLKTQGFYPESYPTACGIYSSQYYNADSPSYRQTLYGCNDGYIRYFKDTAKDDDTGAADTAISSYVTLAPFPVGDGFDNEGKIKQIVLESGGGASGGDYSDTDGFSYDVHIANDAETTIEDVIDGATANLTGTITGTGRKSRIRQKIRGQYATIKLYNNTAAETFAINRILIDKEVAGRLKDT